MGFALSNPALSPTVEHPATNVLTGNSPGAAWTDLDLSAVVGANEAVVLLKVKNTDASGVLVFRFRPNGDADTYVNDGAGSSNSTGFAAGGVIVVVMQTDAAGIVEWYANAVRTCEVDVLTYWKRANP